MNTPPIPELCLENGCAKLMLQKAEVALEQGTVVDVCPLMAQIALSSSGRATTDQLLAAQVVQCGEGNRNIVRQRMPSSADAVWTTVALKRALRLQKANELVTETLKVA